MSGTNRFAWTCSVLVVMGCGADGSGHERHDQPEPDGGADAGSGAHAADAGAPDAAIASDAASDAGMPPPNDSFAAALPLDLDSPFKLHDITRPSQVDYYAFEAEAGAFYVLSSDRHPFSPDTIIALFDAEEQQLAENDDGSMWPGDSYDSRLVVRLQHAGKHYVRVSTHLGDNPVTPPVYYHLTITQLTPGDGVTLQETESAAKVHFAHDEMSGYAYATVLGDFAQVHAAAFELQGERAQVLVGHVLPSGAEGNGSTASVGAVQLAGSDEHPIARIDVAEHQEFFHPPVNDAVYRLDAALVGKAGSDGFFAIDLVMLGDNPSEVAEDDNGELAGAEPIELMPENFRRRGLVLARLEEKDVDYYRFEVTNPSVVTVGCEAQSGGSGVLGLHAELRDADDQMLASADEASDVNLLIDAFGLTEPGTYYLRLSSKTLASKDAVEPWARCAVIARP